MSNTEKPQPLAYFEAPKSPLRRWLGPGLKMLSVAVLVILGWQLGPAILGHFVSLYDQSKCDNFTASPSTVVYDKLDSRGVAAPPSPGYDPAAVWCLPLDSPADETTESFYAAAYEPTSFTRFYHAASYVDTRTPVLFLHQRISPSGTVRLVAMRLWLIGRPDVVSLIRAGPIPTPTNLGYGAMFESAIFQKAGMLHNPVFTEQPGNGLTPIVPSLMNHIIRIFAGQPDAADASHFTIDYATDDGQQHTWDGWLQNDGSVKIAERPAATTKP